MEKKSRKKKVEVVPNSDGTVGSDEYYHFTTRFDRECNFWKENPDLKNIEPYKELIKKEGIKNSGRIMDAIWMIYDPKSSLSNSGHFNEQSAKDQIAKTFFRDPEYDWEKHDEIIKCYNSHCKTKIEKQLDFWYNQLRDKTQYLETLPWSSHAEQKNNLLKDHDKLFDKYFEVLSKANEERKSRRLRSGIHRSRVERIPE